MQNNSVNKGIFYFLGARIWAPMLLYWHENPSGYVSDIGFFLNICCLPDDLYRKI